MKKIPSPGELGLNINSWRSGQEDFILNSLISPKRFKVGCAPTGFGKTFSTLAIAILSKVPTCIVTENRGLQDQYMRDGKSVGLVDLRGRRNYACDFRDDYTCEEGFTARCPYKGTVSCPASQAEMRAATSSLVITNYAKWTASKKYGNGMSHFQQVIFDEGDMVPEALSNALQIILNHREIYEKLKIDFPEENEAEEFANWRSWASAARAISEAMMITALARITGVTDPKPSWVRHYNHMKNLTRRLAMLSAANVKEWIVEKVNDGYQFDAIRPGRYSESHVFFKIPSVIAISATIRPKTMFMAGVGKEKFDFKEYDSDFDPKRGPIYYIPTIRVDSRADSLGLLWVLLDQIASCRRDRRSIIQTTSFAYQRAVAKASRFSPSMLLNAQGEPPTEMIEQFRNSPPGTMLVSPSVGRGYDFKDDACRWQFICKIPFDPPSKILKAREAADPEYRHYRAMQKLIQSFGRDVRSKKDWSERFIGDAHCDWFLSRYGHLAPRNFHNVLKTVTVVPAPPRLEDM